MRALTGVKSITTTSALRSAMKVVWGSSHSTSVTPTVRRASPTITATAST